MKLNLVSFDGLNGVSLRRKSARFKKVLKCLQFKNRKSDLKVKDIQNYM